MFLPALAVLLLVRAVVHHSFSPQFAEAVPWSLGAVTVVFRSDLWGRILAHSVLSWSYFVAQAYLCFALLATLHRSDNEPDSITRSVRAELGVLARWPWGLALLPFLIALGLFWMAIAPYLVSAGLTPARVSGSHAVQQAVVVARGTHRVEVATGRSVPDAFPARPCLPRFHAHLGFSHGTGGVCRRGWGGCP
jgi:hypothetical protein